jgi:putative ABC transport system permease protein
MQTLFPDLRFGARILFRHPAFTLIAIITLAVGIGANTAIFSVVNAVLLKSLPYPEADRLVLLNERSEEIKSRWVSYPNFLDWRSRSQSFEGMSTIRGWQPTLTGAGEAQPVNARMVTADFFRIMSVPPVIGRDFDAEKDLYGAPLVTILSHTFWRTRFGADPNIVGNTITLGNKPFTIVGITPESFQFQGRPDLWILTEQYAVPGGPWFLERDSRTAGNVVARLKPGVSLEQARAEMKSIEQQLIEQYPMQNAGNTIRVVTLQESIVGDTRPSFLLLFAAVGLVLLISCANVANLLLARAATRQREFAIRSALGASRRQLLRQLLIESLLLGLTGGVAGLLLATWGVDLLVKFAPRNLPRMDTVSISWPVLAFTMILSVMTGIVCGVIPAWQSTKADMQETLKETARSSSDARAGRLRNMYVVAEVALALVLLVSAGLLIKSLVRLLSSDAGFNPKGVLTMNLQPREAYPGVPNRRQFYSELLERINALPGVDGACILNDDLPGLEPGWQNDINPEIDGRYQKINPGELINVDWGIVTGDYFKTMGIQLKQGRSFTAKESLEGGYVVLIDEQLARRFWPEGGAVGNHIKYDNTGPQEIIGVVGNVHNYGSESLGRIKMYTPFGRFPLPGATLAVRTAGIEPLALVGEIKEAVRSINPNVPIFGIETMEGYLAQHIAPRRFNTWLLGVLAGVSTLLAAVGIYGVMSYAVNQRTKEIGIRIALGAEPRHVMTLVIGRGVVLVLAGVALGLAGSFAATRLISGLMFSVSVTDPLIFIGVPILLVGVALGACLGPARRATRVDPIDALRNE